MPSRIKQSKIGEDLAASYLIQKGYQIIQRNFRCRQGEIDIVCQKNNLLIFIEVKARWDYSFGKPEETITPRKLKSIIKTVDYYKLLNPNTPKLLRIDLIAIDFTGNKPLVKHIENIGM